MDKLSKLINIHIDDYVCISLDTEKERRKKTLEQCKQLNITPKFRIVKRNSNPVQGCLESHIYCIEWAKKNNLKNILIIEDDVLFDTNLINTMKPINIPNDWDMIYFGYNGNAGGKIDENLLKLYSGFTTHCYLIKDTIFDIVLDTINTEWNNNLKPIGMETEQSLKLKAIDVFYSKIIHAKRKKTYGIYPIVAFQRPEFSTIENRFVDYSNVLIQKANRLSNNILSEYRNKNNKISNYDYYSDEQLSQSELNIIKKIKSNDDWTICYLNENKTKYVKRYNYNIDDTEYYLFPNENNYTFKNKLNFITHKHILCIYGNYPADFLYYLKQLNQDYGIYIISDKYLVQDTITYITKDQYKNLPKHNLILMNSMLYFLECYNINVNNIYLWLTDKSIQKSKYKNIMIPNNSLNLIHNFRHKLKKIITVKKYKWFK